MNSAKATNNHNQKIWQTERFWFAVLLFLISALTAVDLIEDRLDGATFYHLSVEGMIILLCVSGGIILWRKSLLQLRGHNLTLSSQLNSTREDLARWRSRVEKFSQGLTSAILDQFKEWRLSSAETDVAFLLLKGFSLKEISELRKTSEQTVRQQAGSIYDKSRLEGRAQLSAFFLEDLLVPSQFKHNENENFLQPL